MENSGLVDPQGLTCFAIVGLTRYNPPSRNPNRGDSTDLIRLVHGILRAYRLARTALAAENPALRPQLAVLRRSVRRPRLKGHDRVFWVWLSQLWADWKSSWIIVKPDTVLRWHRDGFRLYWR